MIGNFHGDQVVHPGNPQIAGDGITQRLNDLLTTSYADNTISSYTSKMAAFITFLTRYSLMSHAWNGANPTIPEVDPTLLMFFCVFLLMRGLKSAGSIQGYCTAVKMWCLIHDRHDPTLNRITHIIDIRYARLHRAIKKQLGTKASEREPLSLRGLRLIIAAFRSGFIVHEAMIGDFITAILLAYYGMLRISEFTNLTTTDHNMLKEACRGDITFFGPEQDPTGFEFVVKCSKTDQFRVTQTITVFRSAVPELCPVRAMAKLIQDDPRPPTAPLFDFTTRATNTHARATSAARSRFITGFQHAIIDAGLSTKKVQSHSLRAGGATGYLQAGVEPYIIQRMGRWRSWCFSIYTWTSTTHIQHAMLNLANCDDETRPLNYEQARSSLDLIRW